MITLTSHYDGDSVRGVTTADLVEGVWVVTETFDGVSTTRAPNDFELLTLDPPDPTPASNPVQLVASAVIAAVESAPNTVAGTQAAIITSLSNFL